MEREWAGVYRDVLQTILCDADTDVVVGVSIFLLSFFSMTSVEWI